MKCLMIKLVLLGGGGFFSEVISIIQKDKKIDIKGYIDNIENKNFKKKCSYLGKDEDLENIINQRKLTHFFVCIGDTAKRKEVFKKCLFYNLKPLNIIYHNATVLSKINSQGIIIYPNSTIMSNVKIGNGVLINSNSTIGHDTEIGEFCNISPGVNIAGKVKIGNQVMIGVGACIKNNITIGNNTTIGAGSVVVKNIDENTIAYGNPAS